MPAEQLSQDTSFDVIVAINRRREAADQLLHNFLILSKPQEILLLTICKNSFALHTVPVFR